MAYVNDHRIPLEICLTSNLQTGVVSSLKDHPFRDYYRLVHQAATHTEQELLGRRPRYILRDLSGSVLGPASWEHEVLEPILAGEYREVLRLDGRVDTDDELPDPTAGGTPTHMLPFARPWSMTRPGPPLILYERVRR